METEKTLVELLDINVESKQPQSPRPVRPTSAGSTLDILGMVVIVFGALSAVVLFITTALVWEITSYKSEVEDFSWNGFVLAVGTLLSSLAVGYLLKTIAGIAKDVRTLAEKK